jgi:tRNA threonylcarbamoyladenosine biosynthesis protein TsaB
VGLARGDSVVRTADLDASRRQARDLTAIIDAMLKAESLHPADLTGVMASRGPGSYTGLRVGLMTAKALAYTLGCELLAVDTFAAIAEQAPPEAKRVWVVADALQGQVYAQLFARGADSWASASVLRILTIAKWVASLPAGDWVSGPGVDVYESQIPDVNPRVVGADRLPRVESVLAVGLRLSPLTKEEVFALEPLYLRGSSAEEKAKSSPRG